MTLNSKLTHSTHYRNLLIAAMIGIILMLLASRLGGLKLTPDSIHFIAGSRAILQGEAFLRYNNIPTASWPPLYPTFIALLTPLAKLFQIDILEVLRFAHSLLFGLTIILTGLLARLYLDSPAVRGVVLAAVILAQPFMVIVLRVWTELLGIVLTLSFFLTLHYFLKQGRAWQFALLSSLCIGSTLQRFGGVGLIPAGCLCILFFMQHSTYIKRLGIATLFGLTVIPITLWILYGLTLPGNWSYTQDDPFGALQASLDGTVNAVALWIAPGIVLPRLASVGFTLLVLLFIPLVLLWWHHSTQTRLQPHSPAPLALYVITMLIFLHIYMMTTVNTPLDQRHLSVLYIFVIIQLAFVVENIWPRFRVKWIHTLTTIIAIGWISILIRSTVNQIVLAPCCSPVSTYRNHSIIQWLNNNLLQGQLFSNTPLPLVFTLSESYMAPQPSDDLSTWVTQNVRADSQTYLVWFNQAGSMEAMGASRFYFEIDYEEALRDLAQVTLIAELDDGRIFLLTPR